MWIKCEEGRKRGIVPPQRPGVKSQDPHLLKQLDYAYNQSGGKMGADMSRMGKGARIGGPGGGKKGKGGGTATIRAGQPAGGGNFGGNYGAVIGAPGGYGGASYSGGGYGGAGGVATTGKGMGGVA